MVEAPGHISDVYELLAFPPARECLSQLLRWPVVIKHLHEEQRLEEEMLKTQILLHNSVFSS